MSLATSWEMTVSAPSLGGGGGADWEMTVSVPSLGRRGGQTGKSGGRKPDHLSSTLGPTWGKEKMSVSNTEGSCFGHTHQCLFPNFGFSFDFVSGLGSLSSTEQYPQPVCYFVFCAKVLA